MRDRVRIIRLATGLAFRAGGWRVPVIMLCKLAISLQAPASAYALKLLTDGALARDWTSVTVGTVAVAALVGVMFGAYGISVPLRTSVTERAEKVFEEDVMTLVSSVPTLEVHERPDLADKLEILGSNSQLLVGAIWSMFDALAFFVGATVALLMLVETDVRLLLLPAFGLPLVWTFVRGAKWRLQAVEQEAESVRSAAHLFRVTTSPAFGKELRTSRIAEEMLGRYERTMKAVNHRYLMTELRCGLLSTGAWIVFTIGWATGVTLVALRARRGDATPGDVVLTIAVAALVQGYVSDAAGVARQVSGTLKTASHYLWLKDFVSQFSEGSQPAPIRLTRGIELQDLSFTYPGTDTEVLHAVNLRLAPGSTVGIVGKNGAGKTTLVKLLLGLYRPTKGRILIDGTDLAEISTRNWRSAQSAAFQDYAMLEFLVRESVGVGDLQRMDDERIVADAVNRAGASAIPALDQQLGRMWSGVELSGGQWQQLAVARGMMRGTPLLRVLDEPTSALDADVEHSLFQRYQETAKIGASTNGCITVLVSHRFSTVRMTDVVIVVDEGRILAVGHHDELMKRGGLYAELYGLQARAYR